MYQQTAQQNYPPPYAPQYGGQTFQPYQAAPSQYVSHAPSGMQMAPSQPAMMNGIGPGPDGLYRGQRPPNPCICCKLCCGGTCSLKTGVIIIGICNIIGALGVVVQASGAASKMDEIVQNVPHASELLYTDGVFFLLVTGILMLIGAFGLEPTSCTASGILMALGGVHVFCEYMYFAFTIQNNPYIKDNMAIAVSCYFHAVIGCLSRFYWGYCPYALGKQIRNGEYSVGMMTVQPMMNVQPTYSTAPMNVANNDLPNSSNMVVQAAVNQEE